MIMSRIVSVIVFFWFVGLTHPPSSYANGDVTHKVNTGETLEDIAKYYYGASWKIVYLIAANNMPEERDKIPDVALGKKLSIPGCTSYKAKKGDSISGIAKKFLGRSERDKALIEANNIKNGSIDKGQEIILPFLLKHIVKNNESMSQIAQRYYRTTRKTNMLKAYNDVELTQPGQKILVPIFDKTVNELKELRKVSIKAKPTVTAATNTDDKRTEASGVNGESPGYNPPELPPLPDRPRVPMPRAPSAFRQALDQAAQDYHRGAYGQACPEFETILGKLDNIDERIVAIQYLGFCAIAYDDTRAAEDYFRKWLEIDQSADLDPISTSPKILAIFRKVAAELASK